MTTRTTSLHACVIALALLVLTAGCGRQVGVPTALPAGQQTRAFQPGDEWAYKVIATVHGGMMGSGTVIGLQTSAIQPSTNKPAAGLNIARTFEMADLLQLTDLGFSTSYTSWLGQDSSNAVYYLAESEDGTKWDFVREVPPPMFLPAVLNQGSSWSYSIRHLSGEPESYSAAVVGVEKVTTPAGEFETYKVKYSLMRTQASESGYMWVRPEFPFGVKSESDAIIPGPKGISIRLHMVRTLKTYQLKGIVSPTFTEMQ